MININKDNNIGLNNKKISNWLNRYKAVTTTGNKTDLVLTKKKRNLGLSWRKFYKASLLKLNVQDPSYQNFIDSKIPNDILKSIINFRLFNKIYKRDTILLFQQYSVSKNNDSNYLSEYNINHPKLILKNKLINNLSVISPINNKKFDLYAYLKNYKLLVGGPKFTALLNKFNKKDNYSAFLLEDFSNPEKDVFKSFNTQINPDIEIKKDCIKKSSLNDLYKFNKKKYFKLRKFNLNKFNKNIKKFKKIKKVKTIFTESDLNKTYDSTIKKLEDRKSKLLLDIKALSNRDLSENRYLLNQIPYLNWNNQVPSWFLKKMKTWKPYPGYVDPKKKEVFRDDIDPSLYYKAFTDPNKNNTLKRDILKKIRKDSLDPCVTKSNINLVDPLKHHNTVKPLKYKGKKQITINIDDTHFILNLATFDAFLKDFNLLLSLYPYFYKNIKFKYRSCNAKWNNYCVFLWKELRASCKDYFAALLVTDFTEVSEFNIKYNSKFTLDDFTHLKSIVDLNFIKKNIEFNWQKLAIWFTNILNLTQFNILYNVNFNEEQYKYFCLRFYGGSNLVLKKYIDNSKDKLYNTGNIEKSVLIKFNKDNNLNYNFKKYKQYLKANYKKYNARKLKFKGIDNQQFDIENNFEFYIDNNVKSNLVLLKRELEISNFLNLFNSKQLNKFKKYIKSQLNIINPIEFDSFRSNSDDLNPHIMKSDLSQYFESYKSDFIKNNKSNICLKQHKPISQLTNNYKRDLKKFNKAHKLIYTDLPKENDNGINSKKLPKKYTLKSDLIAFNIKNKLAYNFKEYKEYLKKSNEENLVNSQFDDLMLKINLESTNKLSAKLINKSKEKSINKLKEKSVNKLNKKSYKNFIYRYYNKLKRYKKQNPYNLDLLNLNRFFLPKYFKNNNSKVNGFFNKTAKKKPTLFNFENDKVTLNRDFKYDNVGFTDELITDELIDGVVKIKKDIDSSIKTSLDNKGKLSKDAINKLDGQLKTSISSLIKPSNPSKIHPISSIYFKKTFNFHNDDYSHTFLKYLGTLCGNYLVDIWFLLAKDRQSVNQYEYLKYIFKFNIVKKYLNVYYKDSNPKKKKAHKPFEINRKLKWTLFGNTLGKRKPVFSLNFVNVMINCFGFFNWQKYRHVPILKFYKRANNSYFFYKKIYYLYFFWYVYLNEIFLFLLHKTFFQLWLTFFSFFNKLENGTIVFYIKNISLYPNKLVNNFSDYTFYNLFISQNDISIAINNWLLNKLSLKFFFFSRYVYLLKNFFCIFDKRSYKIRFVRKLKPKPLFLPVFIFKYASFYFKNGKRCNIPKKKVKPFSLSI